MWPFFVAVYDKIGKMSKNALDTRAQLNRVKLEGPVSFMYRTFNCT